MQCIVIIITFCSFLLSLYDNWRGVLQIIWTWNDMKVSKARTFSILGQTSNKRGFITEKATLIPIYKRYVIKKWTNFFVALIKTVLQES